MFEYIIGEVVDLQPSYVVIESNSIGYKVFTPNPFSFKKEKDTKIFIEQIIRENSNQLFGFENKNQKDFFINLLSVSGIGPKSALAILANTDTSAFIAAIKNQDIKYITQFPGIGKKTASQIILDLENKLNVDDFEFDGVLNASNELLNDALLALETLGYNSKQIKKVESELKSQKLSSSDEYLKQALKILVKR